MNESPTPSKLAKWKRPLIGGLLSAGIAIIIWNGQGLFAYGFEEPLEWFAAITGIWGGIIGIFFSWFLAGAVIAFYVRKNLAAFGLWILLYVLCTILGIT